VAPGTIPPRWANYPSPMVVTADTSTDVFLPRSVWPPRSWSTCGSVSPG